MVLAPCSSCPPALDLSGWSINITDAQGDLMNMTLLALTAQNLQPSNTHNLAVYLAQR